MKLRQRAAAVLGIATVLLCLVGAGAIWKAEHALRGSERTIASGENLEVSVGTLSAASNPGFEAFSTPSGFRGAQAFEGKLYLSGPGGLFVYTSNGVLGRVYRVGQDLPTAPLGQMAVATLSDSHSPELLIATGGEGVLAFDGKQFRQIRPADAESRSVTAILPLPSGRLLIGTAKRGLLVYDGGVLRRFHTTTNDIFVSALAGNEAELWIGTLNSGVLHWRGGQLDAIDESQGLPDVRVESIAIHSTDQGDAVYVGTPAGVAEIRDGKVARSLARGRYARALLALPGELLVGQMEGTVLSVNSEPASGGNLPRRPIAAHLERIAQLRQSAGTDAPIQQLLQIGTTRYAVSRDQLLRQEPDGAWQDVLAGGGTQLTDGNVSSLMVASDGRLWVGYFDRGLDVLPATGGPALHVENDQVFCVNRILENGPQNAVAVATANGLALFDRDGRQKQVLTKESGLIANHVTDVELYRGGMVAGTPAGITFLDSSGAHSIYAFQGLVNNHVYALGVRDGELLAGTLGGISLLKDGAVERNLTTANSGLKANWITALIPAGDGWLVGTYGAGVWRMDADGTMHDMGAASSTTVINPGALLSDGRLVLAGTLGRGLLIGDATGTRWRTVTVGLPSLNVTALAVRQGTVYVGTDNGLVKIAEEKL